MRRLTGRHEQNPLEAEGLARLLGDGQVPDVDRVERPAHDAERAGATVRASRRSHALPGLRLPFELDRADPDRSPGWMPAAPQLGVDAEPREVALEAFGRFLDVEVRLGGDPLDALAARRGTRRRLAAR